MPYRIERRSYSQPWLTAVLVTLNSIAFAATWWDLRSVARTFGFTMAPSGVYTWFTSLFLHGDPFHLLFNMYFLWLFGSFVEEVLGTWRYLALFLLGGLAASLVHGVTTVLFVPQMSHVPAIGASGALAAVMGLFMVRFYRHKVRIGYFFLFFVYPRWGVWRASSLMAIGLWFAGELASGLLMLGGSSDGVARWAHIGGLVFGAVAGLALGAKYDADTEYLADEATLYAQTGSHDVAAVKYQELVARTPDDPEALLGEARAVFGSHAEDTSPGAHALRRAVELLVRQSRPERVLLAWEELQGPAAAVAIDPKTLSTIASIAEAHRRPDMASATYWRVVQEHPGTREAERALFRLCHIYLDSGMTPEASQCWGRFRASHPDSEWLAFADARLSALEGV